MGGTVLILKRKEQILSLLYQENRLRQVNVHEDTSLMQENSLLVGSIYIGKVKNVVPAIHAAFVEVTKGSMGFLPLKNASDPVMLNRNYDGRILAGDELLVQVEKEAMKTKEIGLTCNLSFQGKYMVLTTGRKNIGFSSKLSAETKTFWKQKLQEWNYQNILCSERTGMVIRTNASLDREGVETAFQQEFQKLRSEKNRLLEAAFHRTCFHCLFRPMEGYLTAVQNLYETSFDKIVTDDPQMYQRLREEFPSMNCIELYENSRISLSRLYSVETRLKEAIEERVWMKSGAYLIIQQTEALTVIDVNSGKIQKKHPGDDIYFIINKEAAAEIALQLKLRNLSGIILIDFINQNTKEQDEKLLSYLSSLVKKDAVKTDVIDMTSLGLVEVTRKKIQKPLGEQLKKG